MAMDWFSLPSDVFDLMDDAGLSNAEQLMYLRMANAAVSRSPRIGVLSKNGIKRGWIGSVSGRFPEQVRRLCGANLLSETGDGEGWEFPPLEDSFDRVKAASSRKNVDKERKRRQRSKAPAEPIRPQDGPPEIRALDKEEEKRISTDVDIPPPEPPAAEPADPDGFEAFWEIYPRREDRKAAVRAWAKATARAAPGAITAGAERYRDDPNREAGFTKHAATWLNQECWGNPPLPPRAGRGALRPAEGPLGMISSSGRQQLMVELMKDRPDPGKLRAYGLSDQQVRSALDAGAGRGGSLCG